MNLVYARRSSHRGSPCSTVSSAFQRHRHPRRHRLHPMKFGPSGRRTIVTFHRRSEVHLNPKNSSALRLRSPNPQPRGPTPSASSASANPPFGASHPRPRNIRRSTMRATPGLTKKMYTPLGRKQHRLFEKSQPTKKLIATLPDIKRLTNVDNFYKRTY
jgi:hypothetical protein